jgi:syntaxin 7
MEGYQGNYQNGNFREVDFQFQRLAQNIGTNIQKILQNVSSIQRMMVQIGTPQDNQQLQNQVNQFLLSLDPT